MEPKALVPPFVGALLLVAAAFGINAAMDTPRTLMSPGDHDHALRDIERQTRVALGACRALAETARETCRARAHAEDRIAKAELDARYFGTVSAAANARMVRARARFDVARAECMAGADASRQGCLAAARADQEKAVAKLASAT
jgi:hypothetical protein